MWAGSPYARAVRTWLERSASIVAPRVSLAMIAICGSASVAIGFGLLLRIDYENRHGGNARRRSGAARRVERLSVSA